MKTSLTIFFIAYIVYMGVTTRDSGHGSGITRKAKAYEMIKEGQSLLKDGDLVVRLNRDHISNYIKNFSTQDKSYSHGGIVLYEDGQPWVFHIINGDENPAENFKKDSLAAFCDPARNMAYGIFRYQFSRQELKRLHEIIREWRARRVGFDYAFNLASDDKMYCSEMISKALANATHDRILVKPTKVSGTEARFFSVYTKLPFSYTSKLRIVSIDALYKSPSCNLIKKYSYL